jgi:hexosaminidase
MLTPLTRLIDAAVADSEAARRFAALVDGMLSDAPYLRRNQDVIKSTLIEWRNVRPTLDAMIDRSPSLREAEQLVGDLSEIGTIGLEALSYLAADMPPPEQWRESKMTRLDQAAKPKAEVEFAIIRSVRNLVVLVAEVANLKGTPPAQWRERILALTAEKNR